MLGSPVEQAAGVRNVYSVVIVGPVDHPGFDERILTRDVILKPCSHFRYRPGDTMRLPRLIKYQALKRMLQFVIAQGLRFAYENHRLWWQLCTTIDSMFDNVHH